MGVETILHMTFVVYHQVDVFDFKILNTHTDERRRISFFEPKTGSRKLKCQDFSKNFSAYSHFTNCAYKQTHFLYWTFLEANLQMVK